MSDQRVICPKCRHEIPLTAALSAQIREDVKRELSASLEEQERHLATQRRELEEKRQVLERQFTQRLQQEKLQLEAQLRKQAAEDVAVELRFLREQNGLKDGKLREAQQMELELRRQRQELEAATQQLELDVARKLDEERAFIRQEAARQLTEEYRLRELEKDKRLADLTSQIEELKRKAEQGSQQLQGEVLELELEELLRTTFCRDQIDPVPKGITGADILQRVYSPSGQSCGTIVWETKRTKVWNDGWVQKLKDDQREMKAEVAVLVTQILPKDIPNFAFRDGIWITHHPCALGLATALRFQLIHVALTKLSAVGKQEKMELLYTYLTTTEFRHRVEAIVETFVKMKGDLDKERRAMTRIWEERDKQIERVIKQIAGMYGDMQGIIGSSLPPIPSLSLPGETELIEECHDSLF